MLKGGLLQVGVVGGIPVRVHWTLPLGLYVFSGFHFDGVHWLAITALILCHELGHVWTVRRAGARPLAVELTGFGGLCRWDGKASPIGRAMIAFGGIWAQLLIFAAAEAFRFFAPGPIDGIAAQLVWIATVSNAWMIALNLIPLAPLDGAEAWRLPYLLGQTLRARVTTFKDPVHLVGSDHHDDDQALASAHPRAEEAKRLAAQLLRDAAEEKEP